MLDVDCNSLHYFEGPEWQYLKRGRERFAKGPFVRVDPLGRCARVLGYNSQLVLLKALQVPPSLQMRFHTSFFLT